jgi:hypothetical protein
LQKKTRSILEELDSLMVSRDRENLLENRGTHLIQGVINLINLIRESYDETTATDLERRLVNSIKSQDPARFARGLRKLKGDKHDHEED